MTPEDAQAIPVQLGKWRHYYNGQFLYLTRFGRLSPFWLWFWYQATEWRLKP